jgi:hypothetical protein
LARRKLAVARRRTTCRAKVAGRKGNVVEKNRTRDNVITKNLEKKDVRKEASAETGT